METITVMKLRESPGYYFFRVKHDKATFLLTHQGKPCAKLVPYNASDVTAILPDGGIQGEPPLTLKRPDLIPPPSAEQGKGR